MKKLLLCLVTILGILILNIGIAQAASLTLSPDSGLAGSPFTISGSEFTAGSTMTVNWDTVELNVSNVNADESGNYSSSAYVPIDASVGLHTVKVTGPSPDFMLSYGPRNNWIARIFPRALAAEGDIIATKDFTVTAPPVTPTPIATPPEETPVADTNTAPADTNTQSSNGAAKSTTQSPANSNQATTEPVAPTVLTVTPEPTVQTKSTNEVKEEAKVCYFPWWLWLVLILITAVNLALFWLRYWKKEKQKE